MNFSLQTSMSSEFFTPDAISSFNNFSKALIGCFERHTPGTMEWMLKDIERDIIKKYREYPLTQNNVCYYFFNLLKQHIGNLFVKVNQETIFENPETTFNGYFISILTNSCGATYNQCEIIARCVRKLATTRQRRQPIPEELFGVVEKSIPLVGTGKSPLNELELSALLDYLKTKKRFYVDILLGSLYEMNRHSLFFTNPFLTEQQFKEVCNSPWMYLLTYYSYC